jgi:N-acetylmuramoyl-L-alanine amidase
LNWLLLTLGSVFAFSVPVEAGQLVKWRWHENANRLDFGTNAGVQPKAMLIYDPTRLIIDLPGTLLKRPTVKQPLKGQEIRLLRIGQLDDTTTRLVIEVKPGYTLDPTKVQFLGTTAQQWSVFLPKPQRIDDSNTNCFARHSC